MTPRRAALIFGVVVVIGAPVVALTTDAVAEPPAVRTVPAGKLVKAVRARDAARAEARRLRVEVRELRRLTTLTPESNRELGRRIAAERGWTGYQWTALERLWSRESGWKIVWNRAGSGACHIPQALPCSKIPGGIHASPAVAVRWGMGYIAARYGTPAAALAHSDRNGWY